MARSLVIAPQWIGDAVMAEPLLAELAARGETLTVAALPWVAPVYRAMPQVREVIEFPFQHGGLQLKARRQLGRELQGRFESAYVLPNSLKSALLPFLADVPRRVGYLGEARVGLLTHRLKNPKNKPPMVAFYSALSGEEGWRSREKFAQGPASPAGQCAAGLPRRSDPLRRAPRRPRRGARGGAAAIRCSGPARASARSRPSSPPRRW